MDIEENKVLVTQYYNIVFNQGDMTRLNEFLAPNFVEHNAPSGTPSGIDGVRQVFEAFFKSFPDRRCEVIDLIAESNKVVAHVLLSGTHTGEFMGQAPTENCFSVTGIDIFHIQDGKITDHWAQFDEMNMLQQIFNTAFLVPDIASSSK